MERLDSALEEIGGDGAVRGEHKFLDKPVGDIALAASDANHALLLVELDDRFGQVEIDGAVFITTRVQEQR